MWRDFLVAVSLLLILEGVFPFLSPGGVRRTMAVITTMADGQLRSAGLTSMALGVVLLYIVDR